MFILRKVQGKELHEIADLYNGNKRRREAGKTLTPAAVCARVSKFGLQFPQEAAQILGQASQAAVEPTVETATTTLVTA